MCVLVQHRGWNTTRNTNRNTIRNTIREGGKASNRVWNTDRNDPRFLEFLFSGVFLHRGARFGGFLLRPIGNARRARRSRLLRLGGSRNRLQPGQFYVSPVPRFPTSHDAGFPGRRNARPGAIGGSFLAAGLDFRGGKGRGGEVDRAGKAESAVLRHGVMPAHAEVLPSPRGRRGPVPRENAKQRHGHAEQI